MKLDAQVVGNVGLYYTCYQLSLHGWNAMPTARNARGIDVIAYSRDGARLLGFQVKALSKRDAVPLGASIQHLMGDFWVVVNKVTTNPTVFVLLPGEVKQLAHRVEKAGSVSYWLEPGAYDQEEYRKAWERVGRGDIAP